MKKINPMEKKPAPTTVGSSVLLGVVGIDVHQSRLFLPDGSSLLLGNPKLIRIDKWETICQFRATDGGQQIFYANLVVRGMPQRVAWQIQICLSWLKAKCGNALNFIRRTRLSSKLYKNMISGFHNFMCNKSSNVATTSNMIVSHDCVVYHLSWSWV